MLIPYDQIADFTWRALTRGADDPTHPMHLLNLATVGPDSRPSARLMINRGAEQTRTSGSLWFHTDSHTPKVSELHAIPFACVTAWDGGTGVHLRLHGRVRLHQHDDCSKRHWEQLSSAAQWLYDAPDDQPSLPSEPPDLRLPRDKRKLPRALTARERERFVVIQVSVETIDWLQATQNETRRAVLRAAEHWVAGPA